MQGLGVEPLVRSPAPGIGLWQPGAYVGWPHMIILKLAWSADAIRNDIDDGHSPFLSTI